jgi:tetratricopeptide (TPR) repeat protein
MMSTLEPSAEIFKKIGLCMIYVENLKGAIKNLRQSANMEESAECYSLLANCYYLLEEYDSAIENYQKSVDLNDKSTQTLYNMAICYDQKEQFMTSKAIYEMILQE